MKAYKKTSVSKTSDKTLLEEYIISDKGDEAVNTEFSYENEKAKCTVENSSLEEITGGFNGHGRKRSVVIF